MICNLSLEQVNEEFNMNGRLLDPIFSNDNDFKVSRVNPFVLPEDNHYPTLYFASRFPIILAGFLHVGLNTCLVSLIMPY